MSGGGGGGDNEAKGGEVLPLPSCWQSCYPPPPQHPPPTPAAAESSVAARHRLLDQTERNSRAPAQSHAERRPLTRVGHPLQVRHFLLQHLEHQQQRRLQRPQLKGQRLGGGWGEWRDECVERGHM
jgi:hypothetical protein